MNSPQVWEALEVPSQVTNFSVLSEATSSAFSSSNDMYVNTMPQVKYNLENGIDVLVYNGNLDLACNSAGNKRWTDSLVWNGQAEFSSKDMRPWFSNIDGIQVEAGAFKTTRAYIKKDSPVKAELAFVTVHQSGHMVSGILICIQWSF